MSLDQVSLPLAFAAGLVSFLSPCVLPLVPAYLAYLSGAAGPAAENAGIRRPDRAALAAGLAFVAGLSVVVIAVFYVLRALLLPARAVFAPLAGIAVIILAVHMSGLVRLPLLDREARLLTAAPRRAGMPGGFLLGAGLAAGWTPCIGATLGAVISSGIVRGATPAGLLLIFAYCLGLGLPFLLLGLAVGRAHQLVRLVGRNRRAVDFAGAGVLALMGVLLLTNNLLALTQLLARLLPAQLADPFGL